MIKVGDTVRVVTLYSEMEEGSIVVFPGMQDVGETFIVQNIETIPRTEERPLILIYNDRNYVYPPDVLEVVSSE